MQQQTNEQGWKRRETYPEIIIQKRIPKYRYI